MSYVIDFELAGIPATHTFERFTWAEAAYHGLTRNPDCQRAELVADGVTVARHQIDGCRSCNGSGHVNDGKWTASGVVVEHWQPCSLCSGTGYRPGSISGFEPPESTEKRCECNPLPRLPELSNAVRAELAELVEQMVL